MNKKNHTVLLSCLFASLFCGGIDSAHAAKATRALQNTADSFLNTQQLKATTIAAYTVAYRYTGSFDPNDKAEIATQKSQLLNSYYDLLIEVLEKNFKKALLQNESNVITSALQKMFEKNPRQYMTINLKLDRKLNIQSELKNLVRGAQVGKLPCVIELSMLDGKPFYMRLTAEGNFMKKTDHGIGVEFFESNAEDKPGQRMHRFYFNSKDPAKNAKMQWQDMVNERIPNQSAAMITALETYIDPTKVTSGIFYAPNYLDMSAATDVNLGDAVLTEQFKNRLMKRSVELITKDPINLGDGNYLIAFSTMKNGAAIKKGIAGAKKFGSNLKDKVAAKGEALFGSIAKGLEMEEAIDEKLHTAKDAHTSLYITKVSAKCFTDNEKNFTRQK